MSESLNIVIRRNLSFTLLLCGAGFAFPFLLNAYNHAPQAYSYDVLNLYSLAAWMGYSHFFFAYRGQFRAVKRHRIAPKFFIGLTFSFMICLVSYHWLGHDLFSFIAWVTFIPHFLKAEKLFSQSKNVDNLTIPFTCISFAIFTYAIFGYDYFLPQYHTLITFGLIVITLPYFISKKLFQTKDAYFGNYIILAFFFLGEALLWAAYNPYMSNQFQYGIYTFHIAGASFFHYFQSYNFAIKHSSSKNYLRFEFVLVNILIISLGVLLSYYSPIHINTVQYFTIGVLLHLFASEIFNYLKK